MQTETNGMAGTNKLLLFSTDELAKLVRLDAGTILRWVARGDFEPTIKSKGRGHGGHFYSAQQALRLAMVAYHVDDARRKGTIIGSFSVRHIMTVSKEEISDEKLIRNCAPDRDAYQEEAIVKELAEQGPAPDCDPDQLDRLLAVLREIRRRLRVAAQGPRPAERGSQTLFDVDAGGA
jgi:hypothetical protein